MESEAMNAKAFRGGQLGVSAATIGPRETFISPESAVQQNLNGLIMDRRSQHFAAVSHAYELLSNALDRAADDGFSFNYTRGDQAPNTARSIDAAVPSPVRILRNYEIEISSQYNPPI